MEHLWEDRERGASREGGGTGQYSVRGEERIRPDLPRLGFIFQVAGAGRISFCDRQLHLDEGDLALHLDSDTSCLPVLRPEQAGWTFHLGTLAKPRQSMLAHLPITLPAANPATQLLTGFGRQLAAAESELPAALRKCFIERLLGMVDDTLANLRERDADLPHLARFHLHRIKAYVRAHPRDPDLSVKTLAEDLGLSVSHVHRIFALEGGSVADWFWHERLDGCAAELASPAHAHHNIGEIALAWGFNDLSHFSHAFRKRYGVSPREWRKASPWREPLRGFSP